MHWHLQNRAYINSVFIDSFEANSSLSLSLSLPLAFRYPRASYAGFRCAIVALCAEPCILDITAIKGEREDLS